MGSTGVKLDVINVRSGIERYATAKCTLILILFKKHSAIGAADFVSKTKRLGGGIQLPQGVLGLELLGGGLLGGGVRLRPEREVHRGVGPPGLWGAGRDRGRTCFPGRTLLEDLLVGISDRKTWY